LGGIAAHRADVCRNRSAATENGAEALGIRDWAQYRSQSRDRWSRRPHKPGIATTHDISTYHYLNGIRVGYPHFPDPWSPIPSRLPGCHCSQDSVVGLWGSSGGSAGGGRSERLAPECRGAECRQKGDGCLCNPRERTPDMGGVGRWLAAGRFGGFACGGQ
jgi:hypothetical protein